MLWMALLHLRQSSKMCHKSHILRRPRISGFPRVILNKCCDLTEHKANIIPGQATYVQKNIFVQSRSHCCRGKEKFCSVLHPLTRLCPNHHIKPISSTRKIFDIFVRYFCPVFLFGIFVGYFCSVFLSEIN